jgi:uncharacterized protein YqgC (DUF456 family)
MSYALTGIKEIVETTQIDVAWKIFKSLSLTMLVSSLITIIIIHTYRKRFSAYIPERNTISDLHTDLYITCSGHGIIVPIILATFPLMFGFMAIINSFSDGQELNSFGISAGLVGLLILSANVEKYIDIKEYKLVRRKTWLMFNWGMDETLAVYKAISIGRSGGGDLDGGRNGLQVTLSSKYEKSLLYWGSGCNNHIVKLYRLSKRDEAISYAKGLAKKLNLEFNDVIEK